MVTLFDAAYPNFAVDPHVDGCLVYIGGDTPHEWTDAEVRNAPGPYRLPTYVCSNPWARDPIGDSGQAIAWLQAHGVPKGCALALDLETAVHPVYVLAFGQRLHAAGYAVWNYESKVAMFQNPPLDGVFIPDWTGQPHLFNGAVVTQYASLPDYDLDEAATVAGLWNIAGPSANAAPITVQGVSVLQVQQALNAQGAKLVLDGQWGPLTAAAVIAFQTSHLLTADGIVGPITWIALTHDPAPAPLPPPPPSITNLAHPAVGIVAAKDLNGYYLVASDGGVFALGDAVFHGSAGGVQLAAPVVGMALTPSGNGYWLVGADGGVFNYGDAALYGSLAGEHLNAPVVGISAAPDGLGYWIASADGGVFNFGSAKFAGSEAK